MGNSYDCGAVLVFRQFVYDVDAVLVFHLLWRCPWVEDRNVGTVFLQGIVNVYDACVAHVGTVLLEGEAHDDYLRAKHLDAFLEHQLDGLVGDVCTHTVVHASSGKDYFRVVSQTLRALGQIVWVHRYAMSAHQARVHLYEVPLSACGF